MKESELKYKRILQQQLNSKIITKKVYKKEIKFIREIVTRRVEK